MASDWAAASFTLDHTANLAPDLTELGLVHDNLEFDNDGVTADPRITGTVTNDGNLEGVKIELDLDGDELAEFALYSTSAGQFWHLPRGLATGTVTVRARAVEPIYGQVIPQAGPWKSLTFTLADDPDNALPIVSGLSLPYDTGASATDGITGDPRIRGTISDDAEVVGLRVQFDLNGDNQPEAEQYSGPDGSFTFSPIGLSEGSVTIQARAIEWNSDRQSAMFGPWTSFSFNYSRAANLAPTITQIRLAYDTGESASDGVTSDLRLMGIVANDGSVAGLIVQLDANEDGVPESSALCGPDGTIWIDPVSLTAGTRTVRVRAQEWIPEITSLAGGWTSFTFTLDPTANLVPTVSQLRLLNDTGSSGTDEITGDSRVRGVVHDDGRLDGLALEFDHNGDDLPDGTTVTDDQGIFQYTPLGLPDGPVLIRARAGEPGPDGGVSIFGGWTSLTFTIQTEWTSAPPVVAELRLFKDSGESENDLITSDPRLTGHVTNDGTVTNLRVEFDYDDDGFAEAATTTDGDGDGDFVHAPHGLNLGPVTVRARAGDVAQSGGGYVFGAWEALSFTWQGPEGVNLTPEVFKLRLLDDTGSSNSDRITTQSTLIGWITNDGPIENLTVEFDHNADGQPEGHAATDIFGRVVYEPAELEPGEVSIQARVTEWDAEQLVSRSGSWKSITFTLEAVPATPAPNQSMLPRVQSLRLVHDTGDSPSDAVTQDATITGAVGNLLGTGRATVQFDHDQDGIADHEVEADWAGEFEYTPEGLPAGPATIRTRAGQWDDDKRQYEFGDWRSLSFTLEPDPANTAPAIAELQLVYDTGTSNTDQISSDPALYGRVTDNRRVSSVLVELDHNGDGVAEESIQTERDGTFLYVANGLVAGEYTIQARAREWDPGQASYIYGDWVVVSFTLDYAEDLPPEMLALELLHDTGDSPIDHVTSDATITGKTTNDGNKAGLFIEFDHNGDGMAEAWSMTTADGIFWYAPLGLGSGSVVLRAQVAECRRELSPCVPGSGPATDYLFSDWMSLSFALTFPANAPAQVADIHLKHDTGISTVDRITNYPRLVGTVTNDEAVGNLRVEFDHNGDGTVDGVTFTDNDGSFHYDPIGLSDGPIILPARTREWDEGQAEYMYSDWAAFAFTLDPAANVAAQFTSLALLHDTGISNSDGITRDPRVRGTISNDGELGNVRIEFDHNGDGVADGSTRTDTQGQFLYAPAGLGDGPVTLRARPVEEPLSTDHSPLTPLYGDWVSINFTLDHLADAPPTVIALALANDDGSSTTDGVTTDPTIQGEAANDDGVLHMIVEFDLTGDGTSDGQTITDHDGRFSFRPQGLAPGAVTIRARAKAKDFGDSEFIAGDWSDLSFTLQVSSTAPSPADPHGLSAREAFERALRTTIETYNAAIGEPADGAAFRLPNGSFAPNSDIVSTSSSVPISPATRTPLRIDATPAVPVSASLQATTTVPESGRTERGMYSASNTVTTNYATTATGDSFSGSFSTTISVCDSFSYSETGLVSEGTGSTNYQMTESGSFCFSYSESGTYTVAGDGSISISGAYSVGVSASYGFSFSATSNVAVIEPWFTFTASSTDEAGGGASLGYSESGTYNADTQGSSLDGAADISASANGSVSSVTVGNYSVSLASDAELPANAGASSPMSAGAYGSFVLSLSASFNASASAGLDLIASGSSIFITGDVSSSANSSNGLSYNETGSFSASGGGAKSSGNYLLSLNDSSGADSFSSATFTITESGASLVGTVTGSSSASAGFRYAENGQFSSNSGGASSSGTYSLLVRASASGGSGIAANVIATDSSFGLTGDFASSGNGSGSIVYAENGEFSVAGTTASYSTFAYASANYGSGVVGGFAITDSDFAVGGYFHNGSGSSYLSAYEEKGTTTVPGMVTNYKLLDTRMGQSGSSSDGSFFVTNNSFAITGRFGSSDWNLARTVDYQEGTKQANSATFHRLNSADYFSSSSISGHFFAGAGQFRTIGNYSSSHSNNELSSYDESGEYFSDWTYSLSHSYHWADSASDTGSFIINSNGFTSSGDFTQARSATGSENWDEENNHDDFTYVHNIIHSWDDSNTVTGTYSITPTSQQVEGDYSSSRFKSDWSRLFGRGPLALGDEGIGGYDRDEFLQHDVSFDDQGTFTRSVTITSSGVTTSYSANGTSSQFEVLQSDQIRTELGIYNLDTSFWNFDSSLSLSKQSSTSHYSIDADGYSAHGPYETIRTSNVEVERFELGKTADGACYKATRNQHDINEYNDSGYFYESGTYWSRAGDYENKMNLSSKNIRIEKGNLQGGSFADSCDTVFPYEEESGGGSGGGQTAGQNGGAEGTTGAYTQTVEVMQKDEQTDAAGYFRATDGYWSQGDYSTSHFVRVASTRDETGNRTGAGGQSSINSHYSEVKVDNNKDKGKYKVDPDGTHAAGTSSKFGSLSLVDNANELGNRTTPESTTNFSQNRSRTIYETNGSESRYGESPDGSAAEAVTPPPAGTDPCPSVANPTGTYSFNRTENGSLNESENGTYSGSASGTFSNSVSASSNLTHSDHGSTTDTAYGFTGQGCFSITISASTTTNFTIHKVSKTEDGTETRDATGSSHTSSSQSDNATYSVSSTGSAAGGGEGGEGGGGSGGAGGGGAAGGGGSEAGGSSTTTGSGKIRFEFDQTSNLTEHRVTTSAAGNSTVHEESSHHNAEVVTVDYTFTDDAIQTSNGRTVIDQEHHLHRTSTWCPTGEACQTSDQTEDTTSHEEFDIAIGLDVNPEPQPVPPAPGGAAAGDGSGGSGASAQGMSTLDKIQLGLDIVGLIPGIGEVADFANGMISLARGDWVGASLSFVSMIPLAGDAIGKAGKLARFGLKHGDEVVGVGGKLCKTICNGVPACFTAGHQILEVVGEVDPALGGRSIVQLTSVVPPARTAPDESRHWGVTTLFVTALGLVAAWTTWQIWPNRRRRLDHQNATDAVLAGDDTLTLRHRDLLDDSEARNCDGTPAWEDEDMEIRAGRSLAGV